MLTRTPLKRKSGLRPVSKKLQSLKRVYQKVAAEYLQKHPFCQHYIRENGMDEAEVIKNGGKWFDPKGYVMVVPRATEIHHMKGRGKYLLDTRYFMACRPGHCIYIHGNTKDAYARGYMLPRND